MKTYTLLIQLKGDLITVYGVRGHRWMGGVGILEVELSDYKAFFNLTEVVFAIRPGDVDFRHDK